jgi:hypothetical protein
MKGCRFCVVGLDHVLAQVVGIGVGGVHYQNDHGPAAFGELRSTSRHETEPWMATLLARIATAISDILEAASLSGFMILIER